MKSIPPIHRILPILVALALLSGCATERGFPPIEGIQNFDEVDAKLLRGAQPSAYSLNQLAKASCGVTVINLRNDPWSEEEQVCKLLGIRYVWLPWSGARAPTVNQIDAFLSVIRSSPGPVFVHCQHGCDRTSTAVACYRIRILGESNRAALNDADLHGLSTWEFAMRRFIKTFK